MGDLPHYRLLKGGKTMFEILGGRKKRDCFENRRRNPNSVRSTADGTASNARANAALRLARICRDGWAGHG